MCPLRFQPAVGRRGQGGAPQTRVWGLDWREGGGTCRTLGSNLKKGLKEEGLYKNAAELRVEMKCRCPGSPAHNPEHLCERLWQQRTLEEQVIIRTSSRRKTCTAGSTTCRHTCAAPAQVTAGGLQRSLGSTALCRSASALHACHKQHLNVCYLQAQTLFL